MTDKEFKRLNRAQLIEIIYQFQIKVEELTQENKELQNALEDKRLRITRAGNIAEAALEVNQVMQAAQNAAQQYLDEIRALYSEIDDECQNIRKKANAEADTLIVQANAEASEIVAQARKNASGILNQAKAKAGEIIGGAIQRQQAEAELERILWEYGVSSGK